jgi:hypothetical protein
MDVDVSAGRRVTVRVGVSVDGRLLPARLQPEAMVEMIKTRTIIFFKEVNTFNGLMN